MTCFRPASVLLLFTPATADFARLVMSDLPAAALAVLEVLLLATGGWRRALVAGAIAGALVWVRLASVPLIVAGVVGLTAYPQWRRLAVWYAVGALPALVALAAWQAATFGSPVMTSYQAAGASSNGRAEIQSLSGHSIFSENRRLGTGKRSAVRRRAGGCPIWRCTHSSSPAATVSSACQVSGCWGSSRCRGTPDGPARPACSAASASPVSP